MSRAVLLPTPGDPLMLGYWLRHARVWRNEVDELRVLLNGETDPTVRDYARREVEKLGGEISFQDYRNDHGLLIAELLASCRSDYVMLAEDDCYVRFGGVLDAYFTMIENGIWDVVGSPRSCTSEELVQAAVSRFGPSTRASDYGDGHGLWPAFLFARSRDLAATDGHFGARAWAAGEHVLELDHTVSTLTASDTFTSAAWQLRNAGLRVLHVPQYHAGDEGTMRSWLARNPPPEWLHVGSLSSLHVFREESNQWENVKHLIAVGTLSDRSEWAKRFAWLQRYLRTSDGQVPERDAELAARLHDLVEESELGHGLVDFWDAEFNAWVTWKEYP